MDSSNHIIFLFLKKAHQLNNDNYNEGIKRLYYILKI